MIDQNDCKRAYLACGASTEQAQDLCAIQESQSFLMMIDNKAETEKADILESTGRCVSVTNTNGTISFQLIATEFNTE